MVSQTDTIAAIATPPGSGGIAIIRISGPDSIRIASALFRGQISLGDAESHRAYYGEIHETENPNGKTEPERAQKSIPLDSVLVTVFLAPHSYTAEDTVEISCHGGQFVTSRILQSVLHRGARLAEPGEFTMRAFLNGRMDLSQAEAVADLIRAKTDLSLRAALSHLRGDFSERIRGLRQGLIDICSLLELELDFAEEDVEFADRAELESKLSKVLEEVSRLLATYEKGKILREGAKLAIVGKPNVGKSSLMNALLNENRAIVTDTPGTTRDTLEEQVSIGGIPFRVVDTAGLRVARDIVEKEGVRRTREQIRQADFVLCLFDGAQDLDSSDEALIHELLALRNQPSAQTNGIVGAINKIDLERRLSKDALCFHLGTDEVLEISAKDHLGFAELEGALVKKCFNEGPDFEDEPLVANLRQRQAIELAVTHLEHTRETLLKHMSSEFAALDLRAALDALGEVIGEVTTEDILGNIFSKFCIGK